MSYTFHRIKIFIILSPVSTVAPSAPADLLVDWYGATWVFLSWVQSDVGIPPLSRHIIFFESGGKTMNMIKEGIEPAANVTGLLPGTNYTFRVIAVSAFGDLQVLSSPSGPVTQTTSITGRPICLSVCVCCSL